MLAKKMTETEAATNIMEDAEAVASKKARLVFISAVLADNSRSQNAPSPLPQLLGIVSHQ